MTDITVKLTGDEVQYLANAIDTHIKTHGLGAATMGVMIVSKFQTASNGVAAPVEKPEISDGTNKKKAAS